MTVFGCEQCGASLAFDGVRAQVCPYCASGSWVERPPAADRPDPALVVTFVGDAQVARGALDRWLGTRWFADRALRRARVEGLRGVYVPAYLYSAAAHTTFTAQIGETYTETETREVEEKPRWNGRGPVRLPAQRTESRTVTRMEYRPLAGGHVGYVTDVVVSASAAVDGAELRQIEPFDLRVMRRYAPPLVAGWIVEEAAAPAEACRRACRAEAVDRAGDEVRRFLPGDSHSDLTWQTRITWESLDPILVPLWVLAVRYREDRPALRVVINGQTLRVAGRVPRSWRKIVAVVIAALAVAALVVWRLA